MSTISHPRGNAVIHWPRSLTTWILAILIAAGLLLGSMALLESLQPSSGNEFRADRVPVVQNQVIPILAPLAPAPGSGVAASSTPVPALAAGERPAVIPVPVPTPPSQ